MPDVTLYEMSPRDGLQNESRPIPTEAKIALIDRLSLCGFTHIEVTSFVSPKWVPQLADAEAVFAGITRRPGITYAALTPNLQGFNAALRARATEVAIFASASETFSRRNINCSIAESLARFAPVAAAAREARIPLRGYVSCVTDCPFEGPVAPEATRTLAARLLELGCHQVSLGDTIGHATPETTARLLETLLPDIGPDRLAGHFHDTRGKALANIETALGFGLRVFDTSCGGLGGCPYAPGASGNVATESVAARLEILGLATGLDPDLLAEAARFARTLRDPDAL